MVETLSEQHIIDGLNTNYGINVARLTLLSLGADINAFVYKADAHDQSSYFIKLKLGHNHVSSTVISLLHDAGIQNIISPIKNILGQDFQPIHEFTLSVFPFVQGQDGFSRNLSENQWITFGKVMKQIHGLHVPHSIQHRMRRENFSSKRREAVRSLYSRIESIPSTDEISSNLIAFMKNHSTTIHRLVDRADELSKQIQNPSPEFVLCHSDIHGGNVLIAENDFIYIVDWDDPIIAPKERDLMFIGGGVANVWNKPEEEKLFYQGYGKTDINMSILSYYRHERIVEDIAIYAEQLLFTSPECSLVETQDINSQNLTKALDFTQATKLSDNQNRAESYKQFLAQFEPHGVVEIAFKTD